MRAILLPSLCGGLATNPKLTRPNPPVVGGCTNCLIPHVAVVHQVLHQGVQVTYGQREQAGIRSVVFSCQPFSTLVLIMVTMSCGKPCHLVGPARGNISMHPICARVKDRVVPADTQRERVPEVNVLHSQVTWALHRTGFPWRHGNPSPLAGSPWATWTSHPSSPLTCQLALIQVFHGIGLAEARHADVHPGGIGHFPRGSVVNYPAETGQKVEEPCPHRMRWRSQGSSLDLGGCF